MGDYEIRVLNADGTIRRVMAAFYADAAAAIQSGHRLAVGRPFEIWHDGKCIYPSADPSH